MFVNFARWRYTTILAWFTASFMHQPRLCEWLAWVSCSLALAVFCVELRKSPSMLSRRSPCTCRPGGAGWGGANPAVELKNWRKVDEGWVKFLVHNSGCRKSYKDHPCFCLRVENRTSVLHVFIMGSGWGGVGWGGVGWVDNVHLHFVTYMMLRYCASHIWCYVTVWGGVGWGDNVQLHFLTYMMLRYCASHIWCYVTVPHTYDATLL